MSWRPHYSTDELLEELEKFEFPERFWFGTSTSGYQSEGGHNGPDDPKNNWYYAEQDGRVEATGDSTRFWDLYKEDIEYAAMMGCNAFRMGLEWSRIQPVADPEARTPPPFDSTAIDKYADMIALCQQRGMMPAITLFHWTSPLWLGTDPWLDRHQAIDGFLQYIERAVLGINQRLVNVHHTVPIPYFITMNEPAAMPMATYLGRVFPYGKGRGGRRDFLTVFENLLLAHVMAYEKVHELYRQHGWERPTVTLNPWCSGVYSSDLMLLDILAAPYEGVEQDSLHSYLSYRQNEFYQSTKMFPHRNRQGPTQKMMEWMFKGVAHRIFGRQPFPNLVETVYSREDKLAPWLDVMSFDFYDPFPGNYLETGWFRARLNMEPWDWGVSPDCLGGFLGLYQQAVKDKPIHILENGMAYAQKDDEAQHRRDGANRIDVLKAHLFECIRARNQGVPLEAFFYWTICDNYEWGSFTPRFGMLNVEYNNGARRRPTDAVGNNVAGAYQAIVQAFFAKDKEALREAFLNDDYPLLFEDN